jgi:hypothetical protein
VIAWLGDGVIPAGLKRTKDAAWLDTVRKWDKRHLQRDNCDASSHHHHADDRSNDGGVGNGQHVLMLGAAATVFLLMYLETKGSLYEQEECSVLGFDPEHERSR